jgi:nicotinamidase-related amidase
VRDFEDYCWRDVVSDEDRLIYSAYVRERSVGPRPALVVVHPAGHLPHQDWEQHAERLIGEFRRREKPVLHSLPPRAHPRFGTAAGEALVARPCESAFFSSDLERALRRAGAGSLAMCGAPTSGALRASAVEAKSFGYKVALAEETAADLTAFLHKIALFDLAHKYADVMSLEELIERL